MHKLCMATLVFSVTLLAPLASRAAEPATNAAQVLSSQLVRPVNLRLRHITPARLPYEIMRQLGLRASVELTGERPGELWVHSSYSYSLMCQNMPLQEVLDTMVGEGGVAFYPYTWFISDGFINFTPASIRMDPNHVMNKHIPPMWLEERDMHSLLDVLDRRIFPQTGVSFFYPGARTETNIIGRGDFVPPSPLDFRGGTLRQLANAVAATQPHGYWVFFPPEAFKAIAREAHVPEEHLKMYDKENVLVFANQVPWAKDASTEVLLDRLKSTSTKDVVLDFLPSEFLDALYELRDRAYTDTNKIIDAYWDPEIATNSELRGMLASEVLAYVRTDQVRRFFLKALANAEQAPNLFGALSRIVCYEQVIPEVLPILEKVANSETADVRVRADANSYMKRLSPAPAHFDE